MNRCLLIVCTLVILLCFNFGLFDNIKGTRNCSQEANFSNNFIEDFHQNVNEDNTSSNIMSVEVSYVSDNSSVTIEYSGETHWEKIAEQDYKLKLKPETDRNILYTSGIVHERITTIPIEELHPLKSSSKNKFFLQNNYLEKSSENIDLSQLNEINSSSKVPCIVNRNATLPLPNNESPCITQSMFKSTTEPTQPNAMLIRTKFYCNVSTNLSAKIHSEIRDTCYTYIHEMHTIVQETFEKLVQVLNFANELKKELEFIRNHQTLHTTQSEDQITHIEDCTLDDSYQPNWSKMEESKLKMDRNFHEVKARMLDLDKVFNIFEDLYRNGKHNSKVLQQAGIEIIKLVKTVNTLMDLLQKESNSFLRSVPEFKVKCK